MYKQTKSHSISCVFEHNILIQFLIMENLNSIHSNHYYFHSTYENDSNVDEDEHLLDESQCVKRQRGKNKTYIVFKKYSKEVDLKEVVNDLKNYGWIKGIKNLRRRTKKKTFEYTFCFVLF